MRLTPSKSAGRPLATLALFGRPCCSHCCQQNADAHKPHARVARQRTCTVRRMHARSDTGSNPFSPPLHARAACQLEKTTIIEKRQIPRRVGTQHAWVSNPAAPSTVIAHMMPAAGEANFKAHATQKVIVLQHNRLGNRPFKPRPRPRARRRQKNQLHKLLLPRLLCAVSKIANGEDILHDGEGGKERHGRGTTENARLKRKARPDVVRKRRVSGPASLVARPSSHP